MEIAPRHPTERERTRSDEEEIQCYVCASGFSHNLAAAAAKHNVIGRSIARAEEKANCTHQHRKMLRSAACVALTCALLGGNAIVLRPGVTEMSNILPHENNPSMLSTQTKKSRKIYFQTLRNHQIIQWFFKKLTSIPLKYFN